MLDENTPSTATADTDEDYVASALASKPQATPPPAAQTAPAQAAPQPVAQPQPTGDDDADYVAGVVKQEDSGSISSAVKSFWDWTDKSFLIAPGGYIDKQLMHENDLGKKIIDHEIASAHPFRAGMAQIYYGSMKDAGDFGKAFTTPKQAGIMLLGAGKGAILGTLKTLGNIYFAAQGAQAMYDDRLATIDAAENAMKGKIEGDPDAVQRFLYGFSGLTMAAGGIKEGVEQTNTALRSRVQTKLGISGDLAGKVTDKVSEAHDIRTKTADRATAIKQEGIQKAKQVIAQGRTQESDMQSQLDATKEQIPVQISQMVKDAIPAVLQEQARVSKPFTDMNEMAKSPVTDNASVRSAIIESIKSSGIQDHEIPPKVFSALADKGVAENTSAANDLSDAIKNMNPNDPRLAGLQGDIEALNNTGKPVTFSDLTRVRDDIWDARQSTKDLKLRRALDVALGTVTDMQEEFAVKNNFGNSNREVTLDGQTKTINDMYRNAKFEYMKFRRELGSSLMSDFTKAETLTQQKMGNALAKLTSNSPGVGETMRDLLKMAGVDVKPLEELLSQKTSLEKAIPQTRTATDSSALDIAKAVENRAEGVQAEGTKAVNALGKQGSIIEGKSDYSLKGKTTGQIRLEKMNALADNARRAGIANPYSLALKILGVMRIITGSFTSGGFLLVRGQAMDNSKAYMASLLKKPMFQNWAIKEAGVSPANTTLIAKLRSAITRMATSGALARAADRMAKQPQPSSDAQD